MQISAFVLVKIQFSIFFLNIQNVVFYERNITFKCINIESFIVDFEEKIQRGEILRLHNVSSNIILASKIQDMRMKDILTIIKRNT